MAAIADRLRAEQWALRKTLVLDHAPAALIDGQYRLSVLVGYHNFEKLTTAFQRVILYGPGSGKSHSVASILMRSLRGLASAQDDQLRATRAAFDRQLRSSTEKICRLPAITTAMDEVDLPDDDTGATPTLEQHDATVSAWAELVAAARDEFGKGTQGAADFPAEGHPGPASPCGVIRLATPLVPRAPGRQLALHVQFTHGVQAA
ncbi:hypothetical protein ABZ990_17035 [Streptomyces sp. NPDC046203]|uniref:hypothetical protein n=1 Tax=Streptomyces sp. NPDC046203 TaxID=3154602 RepID=UPI0033C3B7E6